MNSVGIVCLCTVAIILAWFEIKGIIVCIRILVKKAVNYTPSKKKWVRLRAEKVDEAVMIKARGKVYSSDDVPNGIQNEEMRVVSKKLLVRYYYEGCSYTAEIDGYTCDGKTAIIYCRKDKPEIAIEHVPLTAMNVYAALFGLFGIGFLILCEIIITISLKNN